MTTASSKRGKTPTRRPTPANEIKTLWRVLPHPPGSVVRVFARGGDERDGDFAQSAREVRQFAKTYSTHNIYVAPNPTNSTAGSRHSASEVTHWSYFLIDMDPVKKMNNPGSALEEALKYLGEWTGRDFHSMRPIILDSGRGVQAWIRLGDVVLDDSCRPGKIISPDLARNGRIIRGEEEGPVVPARIHRATARRVNGYWLQRLDKQLGLIHGCRIDTSVSDLPRVMRCPGTFNKKTGRMARFLYATDEVFVGLACRLTADTPKMALSDPEPAEGVAHGQPWQMVYAHLTRMAQDYLTKGQEEPGRHKVMWHTAKKLQELGVSRTEARKALRWANRLKGKEEKLPPDQIKHALDTAYEG